MFQLEYKSRHQCLCLLVKIYLIWFNLSYKKCEVEISTVCTDMNNVLL